MIAIIREKGTSLGLPVGDIGMKMRTILFQGTYEYGKQLLQAALVLRRSLRYDLEPNNIQSHRLANAWKKFSQGINERAIRLNNVFIFNKNADAVSASRDSALYLRIFLSSLTFMLSCTLPIYLSLV